MTEHVTWDRDVYSTRASVSSDSIGAIEMLYYYTQCTRVYECIYTYYIHFASVLRINLFAFIS